MFTSQSFQIYQYKQVLVLAYVIKALDLVFSLNYLLLVAKILFKQGIVHVISGEY